MKIQFYMSPVTNTVSNQSMNLAEVYEYITKNSDAKVRTTALRDLIVKKNKGEATDADVREYKASHFDFVLFSGLFRNRTDAGLFIHSGLICLDMDHLGGPEAVSTLREKLLQDPCFPTLLLFTSPSGDGLKWVIGIDLKRCPDHVTWFHALEHYVKERYGVAIDRTGKNVSRACFLPHDPGCYIHPSLLTTNPAVTAGTPAVTAGTPAVTAGSPAVTAGSPAAETTLSTGSPALPAGYEPFDPQAWASRNPHQQPTTSSLIATTINQLAKAVSRSKEALPAASAKTAATATAATATDSPAEAIRYYADLCLSRDIDITQGYDNWLRLGFALSDIFGESGRSLYHDLSRLNSGYDPSECDKQYDKCLHGKGSGVTYRTFFDLLRNAGIDLSQEARNRCAQPDYAPVCPEMAEPVRATWAKMPTGTKEEELEKNPLGEDIDLLGPDGPKAQMARRPTYTFSDQINIDEWPGILREELQEWEDAVDRDKMLLGTLNIISGLIPDTVYAIYDRRRVYAPLFNIFYGGYATRKGDLEACRQIATPLKREMLQAYEQEMARYEEEMATWECTPKAARGKAPQEPVRKSPLIAANSSASAVYRQLAANEGSGAMYETEGDTFTIILQKSEYGDYSDLLRKAHHHETCSLQRVADKLFIEIEKPRLSVLITCTGNQLQALLPPSNVANGLASRFLFYNLPDSEVKFRDVFAKNDRPMEERFEEMGKRILTLHHSLLDRREKPMQFMLSNQQQKQFLQMFGDILRDQHELLGDGIQGFIYRLALECYRYTMVLTLLRRLSEQYGTGQPLFDDDEVGLICDERDFHIATTIIECLVRHTARVFAVLGSHEDDPFAQAAKKPTTEVKKLYQALPDGREFRTSEVLEKAQALRIPERTAKRLLGSLVATYQVVRQVRRGVYQKVGKEVGHE